MHAFRKYLFSLICLLLILQPIMPILAEQSQQHWLTQQLWQLPALDNQTTLEEIYTANVIENTTLAVESPKAEWVTFNNVGLSVLRSPDKQDWLFNVEPVDTDTFHFSMNDSAGNSVSAFDNPVVIRIGRENPALLKHEMPFGQPENRPSSYNTADDTVFALINQSGIYRVVEQTATPDPCDYQVGQGDGSQAQFIESYQAAGGYPTLGCPIGAVTTDSGIKVQWFQNNKLLLLNPDAGVFLLDRDIFDLLKNEKSWLGLPTSGVTTGSGEIEDEASAFTGRFVKFGDKGFIGEDTKGGGSLEAHYLLPHPDKITVFYSGVHIDDKPIYDEEGDDIIDYEPIYGYQARLSFEVRLYGNPSQPETVDNLIERFEYRTYP